MPKRPYPFSADFSPVQLKMHVTQREVNMGVNKEANMKVVYDRTLQLLYDGQKAMATQTQGQEVEMMEDSPLQNNQDPKNETPTPFSTPSPPSHPNDQFRLSSTGQLVYRNSPHKKTNQRDSLKVMCVICQNPGMPVHFVCAYCEKSLCYGCRQICVNCESGFCSNCSTINYDERCDRVFCLNCSY